MSSIRTQLDQARNDLLAMDAELNALTAAKSDASRSPSAFAKWRADHDATAAERERLTTVIENLERDVTIAEAELTAADLRKRYAAKAAANAKLAARIKADLAKANAILFTLVRDVAEAAADDAAINAALPDDLEPLIPADLIARGRPGLDRKELKKTRVMLWVNAHGGGLIGDQDSVVDRGNGLGRIGEGAYVTNCASALFEQVEYHPAEQASARRHSGRCDCLGPTVLASNLMAQSACTPPTPLLSLRGELAPASRASDRSKSNCARRFRSRLMRGWELEKNRRGACRNRRRRQESRRWQGRRGRRPPDQMSALRLF